MENGETSRYTKAKAAALTKIEEKVLLSPREVQSLAGIGNTLFYKEVNRGALKTVHIGSITKVRRVDFDEWVSKLHSDGL